MGLAVRAALGTAASLLLLPAAASAVTTTVDPASSATCARGAVCKTIQAAVDASMAGDTVAVKAGSYSGDVAADVPDLKIAADKGAQLAGSVTSTAAKFALDGLLVFRASGTGAALTASGGELKVTGSVLASTVGPGASITGGNTNVIQRSTLASTSADALSQATTAAGAHDLSVDSSVLIGAPTAAGIKVATSGGSGAVALKVRHVTMPLVAKNGVVLDSTGATGSPNLPTATPTGNITATISGSILHSKEGSTAANYIPKVLGMEAEDSAAVAANKIVVTQRNSDAAAFTGTPTGMRGPQIDQGSPTLTADNELFDSTYHLLVGSPAIGKGGPVAADESQTDLDGDPRGAGDGSDIGADQFVDRAPVATDITVTPKTIKAGKSVTATIKATDPDARDVLGFGFDFGDGTKVSGAESTVSHTYAKAGTYRVDGIVADKANKFSTVVTTMVTVTDGAAPTVSIGAYKLRGFRSGLSVNGDVADSSGVRSVEVALTQVAGCKQFTGLGFAARGGCDAYVWRQVKVSGNTWRFTAPAKVKLRKGKYQLRVRATDETGNTSKRFKTKNKSLVRFNVK